MRLNSNWRTKEWMRPDWFEYILSIEESLELQKCVTVDYIIIVQRARGSDGQSVVSGSVSRVTTHYMLSSCGPIVLNHSLVLSVRSLPYWSRKTSFCLEKKKIAVIGPTVWFCLSIYLFKCFDPIMITKSNLKSV